MTEQKTISAKELQELQKQNKNIIILDIRNKDEFAREHIDKACSVPLTELSSEKLPDCKKADCVIVHCQKGMRTCQAAPQLNQLLCDYYVLEGGLDAWKQQGGNIIVNKKAPLPIHRQVFICVGFLILLSLALAQWVSPWFNLLILFFGCALIFAGYTGFCALAKLLQKLPYNHSA